MQDHVTKPDNTRKRATAFPNRLGRAVSATFSVNNASAQGVRTATNYKGTMLLEADPSLNYEKAVKEFALEMVADGRLVLAFTSRGSPAYLLLKDLAGIKMFVLSESSYPKSSAGSSEVMVPRSDHSVLLNVMDETISDNPKQPKAVIFDSVSALILDAGFQDSYKFLRQVNEILSRGDVISIFLVLSKAHDDRMMNLIKNLYSGHLVYDSAGLHSTKRA